MGPMPKPRQVKAAIGKGVRKVGAGIKNAGKWVEQKGADFKNRKPREKKQSEIIRIVDANPRHVSLYAKALNGNSNAVHNFINKSKHFSTKKTEKIIINDLVVKVNASKDAATLDFGNNNVIKLVPNRAYVLTNKGLIHVYAQKPTKQSMFRRVEYKTHFQEVPEIAKSKTEYVQGVFMFENGLLSGYV